MSEAGVLLSAQLGRTAVRPRLPGTRVRFAARLAEERAHRDITPTSLVPMVVSSRAPEAAKLSNSMACGSRADQVERLDCLVIDLYPGEGVNVLGR